MAEQPTFAFEHRNLVAVLYIDCRRSDEKHRGGVLPHDFESWWQETLRVVGKRHGAMMIRSSTLDAFFEFGSASRAVHFAVEIRSALRDKHSRELIQWECQTGIHIADVNEEISFTSDKISFRYPNAILDICCRITGGASTPPEFEGGSIHVSTGIAEILERCGTIFVGRCEHVRDWGPGNRAKFGVYRIAGLSAKPAS